MSTSKYLYTIGYEGQTLDAFLCKLSDAAVRTLVDVRQLPLSRKRGFSKRALAAVLAEHCIAYVHMPALGCPKIVRDRYKLDGDWSRYSRGFNAHLNAQDSSIGELTRLARGTTACLMCFEADYARCHRSMVARAAAEAGAPKVVHLTSQTATPELGRRAAA